MSSIASPGSLPTSTQWYQADAPYGSGIFVAMQDPQSTEDNSRLCRSCGPPEVGGYKPPPPIALKFLVANPMAGWLEGIVTAGSQ